MTRSGELRVTMRPRAFITRDPGMRHDSFETDGASARRRRDDLAPARALFFWAVTGLGIWIGVIYVVRFILR